MTTQINIKVEKEEVSHHHNTQKLRILRRNRCGKISFVCCVASAASSLNLLTHILSRFDALRSV